MSLPDDALRGAEKPRVRLAPAAARNDAEDAAFLASSYGLTPDTWQVDVLRGWLSVRPDGKWAAPRCGLAVPRQNGKNGIAEIRELFGMVVLGERILHTAHEVKTARKAFARLLEFFDNERQYPELSKLVREIRRTNGQEAVVLTNGGSVEFIARSRGSGRGFSVDVLLMDEAQELSEDAYAALRPTLSASANPQEIVMGTPPGPTSVGEVFTRVRTAGVEGADPRLCWDEWSCEDLPLDQLLSRLDDPVEWAQHNPALGIRLGVETVADERSGMSDETFARERCGWWKPGTKGGGALDPERWLDLADPEAKRGESVVFGLDVTEDRTAWVAVAWRRPDGDVQVMLAGERVPAFRAAERCRELVSQWGGRVVTPRSFEDELERAGVPVEVAKSSDFPQVCGGFEDRLTAGTVHHGNDPDLNEAVRAAKHRPATQSGERAWQLKGAPEIGPLVAAARAVSALADGGGPNLW